MMIWIINHNYKIICRLCNLQVPMQKKSHTKKTYLFHFMKLNGSAVVKLYFFCYMNLRYPTKEDIFIMGSLSTNLTFMIFVKKNPWSLKSTVWLGIYSKWSALMTTYICTCIIVWSFTSRFIQQIYDITKAHHFCCALMIRIYHTWFNLWKVFFLPNHT